MAATLFDQSAAIVAVGAFNPAIFTPDWFESNGLIGPADLEASRQEGRDLVVTNRLARFQTDHFWIQVIEEQLSVNLKPGVPISPILADIAKGVFTLLPHIPLTAIGINVFAHFKCTVDEYYRVGDELAPKTIWDDIFRDREHSVGVENLVMQVRPVARGAEIKDQSSARVTVQPSNKIENGILLSYNDHYDLLNYPIDGKTPAEKAGHLLEKQWDATNVEAQRIFNTLMAKILG